MNYDGSVLKTNRKAPCRLRIVNCIVNYKFNTGIKKCFSKSITS
jgi:hypothetical protein